jgi:hypothetical protein
MRLSHPAMLTLAEPLPANQERVPVSRAGQNGSLGCEEQHTRRVMSVAGYQSVDAGDWLPKLFMAKAMTPGRHTRTIIS